MEEIVRKLVTKHWDSNWHDSRTIEGDVEWIMKFVYELVKEWSGIIKEFTVSKDYVETKAEELVDLITDQRIGTDVRLLRIQDFIRSFVSVA